ncbi:aspartate aminotransferase [Reticulibacter mediterranei]|uniref:Aspartate aminotransferase n=1 Tax=Reticulibacter mediterranei TaxID=2778369 RepID=A0A8J3N2G6_9CHLR|nr:aminotransferase class I/II-fold pyridoxal phosphate-dependent enzyme [Reticulibacter mediterranei]GHO93205.1 aspartate aminotransferase [Reticulibacter mediterranei]
MNIGKQHIYNLPENDITWLGDYARQLEQEARALGTPLPPAVRLQIGEPSFRTPEHIRLAAVQSIEQEPLTYAPPAGWPWLRELLAEKIRRVNGYAVQLKNVTVTLGGTGALQTSLLATVGAGDEVLIPDPGWPLYTIQLAACGAIPVRYPLDPNNEWLPDIASMERLVTPRTRLLLINTPGNPTGAVFPPAVIADLLNFARRHHLYLLSDESYDQIVFEGQHISPATLLSSAELEEGHFIGVYTFSKTYSMTGWRIGYVVAGSQLSKTIGDVVNGSYTNIATPIQRAAVAALTGPQERVGEMRDAYHRRRDIAVRLLQEYGRYIYTPHGAFYALIDVRGKHGESRRGRQFALDLLRERNVAVAPGSGFGSVSAEYIRISLAASENEIERGVREICQFADREVMKKRD